MCAGVFSIATGCSTINDVGKRHPVPGELQRDINGISDACRTPRAWIRVRNDRELLLEGDPSATYEQIDCILTKIRELPYKFEMGIIGREYVPEEAQ